MLLYIVFFFYPINLFFAEEMMSIRLEYGVIHPSKYLSRKSQM